MGVAQRYQKMLIHHSFGMPHLAKYDMQFPAAPFGPEPNKTVPGIVFDALAATANPPKTIAIVTSKFPSAQFQSAGARDVAPQRGEFAPDQPSSRRSGATSDGRAGDIRERSPRA